MISHALALALIVAIPPRYEFEVGQKISYAGKSEARYTLDKKAFNTDEQIEWTLWVVRKNSDGSSRIVLQSNKAATGRSNAETAMGYLDIFPDGRIVLNRSIGYHFDPLRLFPPMQAEVGKGWEGRDEKGVRRYTATSASSFQESTDSPMGRINQSTATADYVFDNGRVKSVKAKKARSFGVTRTETEALELKSVETADVGRFADEAEAMFAAYAAYWDLEDRSAIDPSLHHKAEAVLVVVRETISVPVMREQVDSLLARHRSRGPSQQAETFSQMLGKPGPDWEAKDLDGKMHAIKDYRGQVVILDFWDRGCGWCIRAMPQLKAIQEEFKGQPFQLLGMSLDSDEKNARLVVEEMGITYPTIRAIGLSEGYKVAGIPHLVILDKEGRIADIHIGYAPTLKERVSKTVRELLEK